MDSNDPANTNSNPSGVVPTTPADAMQPASTSPWAQPVSPMPDLSTPTNQIISDISNIPPTATTSWDQPAIPLDANAGYSQPVQELPSNPMTPSAPTAISQGSVNVGFPQQPAAPAPAESPWGAPISSPSVATSDVPTAPQASVESVTPVTPSVDSANPFLQPNAGTSFTMPQAPLPEPDAANPLQPSAPNPFASTTPDPLNTAFSQPGTVPAENPFGIPQSADAVINDAAPAAPNPWDLPPVEPAGVPGAAASVPVTSEQSQPTPTPENPVSNMGQPQPAGTNEGYQGAGQSIPNNPQTGPLDLSALTNSQALTPPPAEQSTQPGNPLPEGLPTENAPTDLSHLIAGEEPGNPAQISGIYTPPVAADQNPVISPVQTPTSEGETPPPGKHLNLTKVLLVAGIPIILIVAALSAYLILGVGQPAPAENTSLPVEQIQGPLTNPPQQIVAPPPQVLPEPTALLPQASILPAAGTLSSPSPAASLSPAMQAAQRAAQSPSPSSSPAASASTSLPVN